jgi:hypothetical protein
MNKMLHILNGDSTLWSLDKAGIDGERLVWRDVLCEGPVNRDFASPHFWEERTKFMAEFFGAEPNGFKTKCIDEFDKIKDFAQFDELILWFEYDLFCQVNMLGIMHFLTKPAYQEMKISLICVGSENGNKNLIGLGEIPPEQFKVLFEKRETLNQEDLEYASKVYLSYCNNDPQKLVSQAQDHIRFPYLNGALAVHLKRFPFNKSGLNEIEMKMLNILQEGVSGPKDVVIKMLNWQRNTFYGFGDAQYFVYLKMLKPLYNNDFRLNDLGNKVVNGKLSAKGIIGRDYQLGGLTVGNFEYDEIQKKIIPA